MVVTLFATHYEHKLMVAARRWRLLVCYLRLEGIDICVVTPGLDDNEYIGEYGETVVVFESKSVKKNAGAGGQGGQARKVIHSPFPYLDVSALHWWRAVRNRRVMFHCSKADILISTYGPAGAMLIGLWFSCKYKIPWILDLRDSFQLPASYSFKPLIKFNSYIEKVIIGKAALCLTVGKVLADYLSDKYQHEFEYIYNGWVDSDTALIEKEEDVNPCFLYAGSIYEHRLGALKLFLDALSEEHNISLRIRLIKDYSGRLEEWLVENNFDGFVEVRPAIPANELESEMNLSVGVLVLEELEPNSWQKGTVTGKLFPLLVSGVPGVVIAHPDVELSKLASKAKGWFCGYDKKSTGQAILSVMGREKNDLDSNRDIFKEYHYSCQARKLLKLCKGAINEYS
jgi:hypothetical protein